MPHHHYHEEGDIDFSDPSMMSASLFQTFEMTAVPAVCMVLGSLAVSVRAPSHKMQGRMQYLSAGLLTGAITTDIFPLLRERLFVKVAVDRPREVDWLNLACACFGFTVGLALMYSVKSLDLEADARDYTFSHGPRGGGIRQCDPLLQSSSASMPTSEPGTPGSQHGPGVWTAQSPGDESSALRAACARIVLMSQSISQIADEPEFDRDSLDEMVHSMEFYVSSARRTCRGAEPIDARNAARLRVHVGELSERVERLTSSARRGELDVQFNGVRKALLHIHNHTHRAVFRRWSPRAACDAESVVSAQIEEPSDGAIPTVLVLAVVIDSVVDGMLIGLASAVALSSGWLMALATSIEMCFLGYSFSCSLVLEAKPMMAACLGTIPPVMMLSASMIAASSIDRVENTPVFVGFTAFALVALMFLVVQEMLLEARRKRGSELWHSSIWLYFGFLLSLAVDAAM